MDEAPWTQDGFDEVYYLKTNRDVADAVDAGIWISGRQHFEKHGRKEGRRPLPAAQEVLRPRDQKPNPDDATENTIPLEIFLQHNKGAFSNPTELSVSQVLPRRIAMVGSCLLHSWNFQNGNPDQCNIDIVTMNNAGDLPEYPADDTDINCYDLQIIQIPFRAIFFDSSLWSLPYADIEAYQKVFDSVVARLEFHFHSRMKWNVNNGLLTFVANFFVPQHNPNGVLFPRFDIRNPEFFVEKVNERLESITQGYKNTYILDLDRISSSLGKRHIQDDLLAQFSHNALMPMSGVVSNRMEPVPAITDHFVVTWPVAFREALWAEIIAMYRAVHQTDTVKLVVVDLDDTMWNGISGDIPDPGGWMVEGWPLGLIEALLYIKKRGILLAVVSKNDDGRIRDIWDKIFHKRLQLTDFCAVKINWQPKVENMRTLLEEVRLLPRSVVFIDDNPVERAAMQHAFPDMRILGRYPYYLRQTLLWSSETQSITVTSESAQRTEMIQAQLQRETTRNAMSREEFLASAAPKATILIINSAEHKRFPRAFELLNKTNQFNTTGRRWTVQECDAFFRQGGVFYTFEVEDVFVGYGLVGVLLLKANVIEQWAMSCRVLGLEVEEAVMATVTAALRLRNHVEIVGLLTHTDVNFPCRDLFAKCGFVEQGGNWVLGQDVICTMPSHVTVSEMEEVS